MSCVAERTPLALHLRLVSLFQRTARFERATELVQAVILGGDVHNVAIPHQKLNRVQTLITETSLQSLQVHGFSFIDALF